MQREGSPTRIRVTRSGSARPGQTLIGTPRRWIWFTPRTASAPWPGSERRCTSARETLLTIRARHRDGGWRWVETSKGVYRAGGAIRIVVNSRDVTRRMQLDAALRRTREELEVRVKERTAELNEAVADLEEEIAERQRVEQELRVSEERWRNLSELSSDMSFAVAVEPDGSLTLEWVTQAVLRITGYSTDEILRRGWRSLLHPEDADRMAPYLSRALEGETREVEGRIIARDGGIRWLQCACHGGPLARRRQAAGTRSDSRHHRGATSGGRAAAPGVRSCGRRRSWRASESWPVASPTISTTCWR